MFEFEKQIMKAEGKFPVISYPYKVVPISDEAKFSFAKYKNTLHRFLSDKEKKRFIEKNLNVKQVPFVGEVKFYEDMKEENIKIEVNQRVLKTLAIYEVPGVSYSDPDGSFKRFMTSPLKYGKDFVIEIGEKIIHESKQEKLTFADIKAL